MHRSPGPLSNERNARNIAVAITNPTSRWTGTCLIRAFEADRVPMLHISTSVVPLNELEGVVSAMERTARQFGIRDVSLIALWKSDLRLLQQLGYGFPRRGTPGLETWQRMNENAMERLGPRVASLLRSGDLEAAAAMLDHGAYPHQLNLYLYKKLVS